MAHRFGVTALALLAVALAFIGHRRQGEQSARNTLALVPAAAVLALALLIPPPLGSEATAADFSRYDATVSWYTWPMHGMLNMFDQLAGAGWIGSGLVPALFVLFLLAMPVVRLPSAAARGGFLLFMAVFGIGAAGFGGLPAPLVGNRDPRASAGPPHEEKAEPIVAALAAEGRRLFNTVGCSNCHGEDGKAGTGGPTLTNIHQQHPDADWYMRFIKDPKSVKPNSTMPAFEELTQEQLRALAEFLRDPKP